MESKVRVVVRVRPFLGTEEPTSRCTSIQGNSLELSSTVQKTHYKFDSCYNQDSEQSQIFAEVSDSIGDVLSGINTTIFAYGMTGAGKTHTMQGNADNPGIIPRVAQRLMDLIEKQSGNTYDISVSYLEIYNEKVFDLLEPKAEDLHIRQDARHEIVIPGLSTQKISSFSQFDRVYRSGCLNRTTAPTSLNKESSRSHAILCLYVQHKEGDKLITGKIHLIDLAGSEDNRHTQNTGLRMTESSNINKSLFVLGKVVNALNDGIRVPYRDSKLTRLLQDSLGGNSNAIMIANIAPGLQFFTETQRTLNFASKSRKIVNRIVVHSEAIQRAPEVDPAEERRRKLKEWKKQKGKGTKKTKNLSQIPDKENLEQSAATSNMSPDKIQELLNRMSSLLGTDSSNLEDRLQRIEQALKEKDATDNVQASKQPVPVSIAIPEFQSKRSGSELSLLTPSTKDRTAKGFLLAGKEQEQRGQLTNALALYENAYRLLPDKNSRLASKIKKLKQLTKDSKAPEVPKKSSLTPEQIAAQTERVLNLINTGDTKELSELHMIAAKRAKLIIAHRPFSSIKDLERVHGVGRRFVEKFYALNVTESDVDG